MIIFTTSKKLKEKLHNTYTDGYRDGAVAGSIRTAVSKTDPCKVLHTVTRELRELDKNTWDHERVDRIRKYLTQALMEV